jgi:hypothetical protein
VLDASGVGHLFVFINRTLLIVIVILVILSKELFFRGGLELCIVAGGTYVDITRLVDKYFVA